MDRRNEEMEESLGAAKLTSSMTTSTASNKGKKLINTNNDDDTSTESSDTFDSWTLLSDKDKLKAVDSLDDSVNRIEILKDSGHGAQEDDEEASEEEEKAHKSGEGAQKQDSLNDDSSDGISIISESESMGRISPHPHLRDHLHDLNLKFSLSDHMDDSILERMRMREEMEIAASVPLTPAPVPPVPSSNEDQHLRQRRKSSSNTTDEANRALQKASQTVAPFHSNLPPIVQKGLQGIFLIGVGLAILALIGKIVNPTWQHLPKVDSTVKNAELEQKVNDMELQNNLMRAEIDLLNKQVKYLSSLNDPYQQQQQHGKYKNYKGSKTFKAWSGNGDTLKPIDISKEDLRKPYKCPDGSFVEIANMCMEQRPKGEPSLVDQFGKVMGDLKEKSEFFKTFEEVAEELHGFQDNPFEQLIPDVPQQNKPIYEAAEDFNQKLPYNEKYQKHRPKGEDYHSSAPYKQHKQGKYDDESKEYKKSFGKDYKKDSKDFRFRDNSKESGERKGDKFNNNSKERKYRKDNSKERFSKQFDDDDSHENSKENHSKERNNNNSKQKRKYDKNGSDEHYSGEWQTNYMKHRENQRKTNEQRYQDNKNWYIKRGDSRENKRSGEKLYR